MRRCQRTGKVLKVCGNSAAGYWKSDVSQVFILKRYMISIQVKNPRLEGSESSMARKILNFMTLTPPPPFYDRFFPEPAL